MHFFQKKKRVHAYISNVQINCIFCKMRTHKGMTCISSCLTLLCGAYFMPSKSSFLLISCLQKQKRDTAYIQCLLLEHSEPHTTQIMHSETWTNINKNSTVCLGYLLKEIEHMHAHCEHGYTACSCNVFQKAPSFIQSPNATRVI